jgi:probable HAF family extracellular repeat protein
MDRMARLFCIGVAVALLVPVVATDSAAAETSPGVRYSVTELKPPSGYEFSWGYAIAQDGTVVGSTPQAGWGSWPVVWAPDGSITALEGLFPSEVEGANGYAVSGDSRFVAGNMSVTDPVAGCSGPLCGFVYENGGLTFFETPYSVADVNDQGIVVGHGAGEMCIEAARWQDGVSELLGTLGTGCVSDALGINELGQIVGESETNSSNYRRSAFSWSDGEMRALPNAIADCYGGATEVNDSGQVVGVVSPYQDGSGCTAWGFSALWRPGGMGLLGQLVTLDARPQAINSHGHVVGYTVTGGFGDFDYHPFFYDDGNMYDLNEAITAGGGWVLKEAHDINDAGQITGIGLHNGKARAFRLDPLQPYELDTNTYAGPLGRVTTTTGTFSFAANQPEAAFLCSIDGSAATPCSSPVSYPGLSQGEHSFAVQAVGDTEVEGSPSESTFVVNSVRIRKIRFDPPGQDTRDNLNQEWVKLRNRGETSLSLRNWILEDDDGHQFLFPRFTLPPDSSVRIHTGNGDNDASNLYWGRSRHVWDNAFDDVWLRRATATPADRCPYQAGYSGDDYVATTACGPYDMRIFH